MNMPVDFILDYPVLSLLASLAFCMLLVVLFATPAATKLREKEERAARKLMEARDKAARDAHRMEGEAASRKIAEEKAHKYYANELAVAITVLEARLAYIKETLSTIEHDSAMALHMVGELVRFKHMTVAQYRASRATYKGNYDG